MSISTIIRRFQKGVVYCMKEYSVKVKGLNSGESWIETITVGDNEDPRKNFEGLLASWNKDYPDNQRKLLQIIGKTGVIFCNWDKLNNVTISRDGVLYDILFCSKCGNRYQRNTFFTPSKIECRPSRTCAQCCKVFKTEKGLEKHNARDNHQMPRMLIYGDN